MGVTLAAGTDIRDSGTSVSEPRAIRVTALNPAPYPEASPVPQHELTVLATVAHELRGPLTALATSSELLAEDCARLEPEQMKGMLAAMHRRTVWLQGLVENLLCAATIREGRLQLHCQSLSITDLLDDVHAVVGPLLSQRGQRLRIRHPLGLPEVMVDSRRLGQVLVNLILNASKFGAPNTCIDLTISRRHGGIRVAVADRGPGVSADQADRLFEPYYRAPATAGAGKDGVGLGLSIVKSIVEAHGGRVGVESRKGGGARFWFVVPTTAPTKPTKLHLSLVP
ncbi:MAG: HAMP domain-containing histidine kinase [Chloroflexi bacterium]|nr:HAMP domain-containing histidine kinase [Chloroflexota bacterium]MBV9545209.1 HAMP domain-containing histidine kinase [Chloroflexota bacterium]